MTIGKHVRRASLAFAGYVLMCVLAAQANK